MDQFNPLSVACDDCGAAINERCKGRSGVTRYAKYKHSARIEKARRQAEEASNEHSPTPTGTR